MKKKIAMLVILLVTLLSVLNSLKTEVHAEFCSIDPNTGEPMSECD